MDKNIIYNDLINRKMYYLNNLKQTDAKKFEFEFNNFYNRVLIKHVKSAYYQLTSEWDNNYKTKYLFDDYSILLIPLTKCVNDYNIHKGNFIKYFKVACKNYLIDSKKYKDDDIKIDYNSEALSKIQVNDIKEEDIDFNFINQLTDLQNEICCLIADEKNYIEIINILSLNNRSFYKNKNEIKNILKTYYKI